MTIGQRISELRKGLGYSQEYIAEKLNVSRQAVSKWEQDLSAPDTYNLIALAELLGVSVEYLATGKRQEVPQESAQTSTTAVAAQPPCSGIGIQRIVGLILLGAGLLALILGCLFSKTLLLISTLLLLYSILCLAVRKHLGMVLLWTSVAIAFFILTILMPVRITKPSGAGVIVISVTRPIFGVFFAIALVFTVIKVTAKARKKAKEKIKKD